MRCVIAILMIGFIVAGCGEEIESPKQLQPLQKGGANTLTLPDGNVVYNMNGEWDANVKISSMLIDADDVVRITQDGNKFVGICLVGTDDFGPGTEVIKGELEKNGFKSIQILTARGWLPLNYKITDNCNKIETVGYFMPQKMKLKATFARK